MPTPRSRYPVRPPGELEPDQRALHQRITTGPRASTPQVPLVDDESGALLGPFAVMTIAPAVGDAVQALGAALRYAGTLTPLVREGVILMVAAHHRCEFEWMAHEGAARAAGLRDDVLGMIRGGGTPTGSSPTVDTAFASVAAMLVTNRLDDAQYDRALADLGDRALAELVWLCGYYSMLALALATFDPPYPLARPVFDGTAGRPEANYAGPGSE